MIQPPDLLHQQLEQGSRRKKPKAVQPAKRVGIEYNTQLQRMVRAIRKDINEQLVPMLRELAPQYVSDSIATNDSYVDLIVATLRNITGRWLSPQFRSVAESIAQRFVTTANNVNAKGYTESFGIDVFAGSPELNDYLQVSAYNNAQLITSIPEQYLNQVESLVMTNVRAGNRPSAITKLLRDQFGVTERRAKMIARDQTTKINGDLSEKRQRAAGFPYFQWIDSDDQRVRTRHENIANKITQYGRGIYRWDHLPLSDKGVPIKPGQDYQCRCIARPVSQAEVDRNIENGLTRKGVKR